MRKTFSECTVFAHILQNQRTCLNNFFLINQNQIINIHYVFSVRFSCKNILFENLFEQHGNAVLDSLYNQQANREQTLLTVRNVKHRK